MRIVIAATLFVIAATALVHNLRPATERPSSGSVTVVAGTGVENDRNGNGSAIPQMSSAGLATPNTREGLKRLLQSERREPAWADSSENSLKAALGTIPFMGLGSPVRITCATTICEVVGEAPEMNADELDQYWRMISESEVQRDIEGHDLATLSATYGEMDNPRAFAIYYRRKDASGQGSSSAPAPSKPALP